MKLVAIMGSPHGMEGTTGKLLQALLEGAEGAGADVTLFNLEDLKVAPCRACDVCHRTGACSIEDDFGKVLGAMLGADAIVLASPNYISSVTAQMKALIDRCCGPLHLMAFDGKRGAAVVTAGSPATAEVEAYIVRFLQIMGCWTVGSVGAAAAQLLDDVARSAALRAGAELGARIVAAAEAGETYADQVPARQERRQMMRRLVMSRADHWTYEAERWRAMEA